jgi:hypothetical protein
MSSFFICYLLLRQMAIGCVFFGGRGGALLELLLGERGRLAKYHQPSSGVRSWIGGSKNTPAETWGRSPSGV